jgi:HD superfamily phosphohydrolase
MSSRIVAKIIRDPIHGYISINSSEIPLLDCALVQRLRNIRQNGMACFTYPALTVSRFEHSLGTMHLADQMLSSALTKSDLSVVQEFLALCATQCNWNIKDVESKLTTVIRAAGLLHDLGQLPFSHTLEEVIHDCIENILSPEQMKKWQEYKIKTEGSLHEFLTLLLIESDPAISQALGTDREIVVRILQASPDDISIFGTLHEVISCDIDADRADYLLRDGRASGAEFGRFDLSRLVEGMRLTKTITYSPTKKESFVIRPTIQALSSVESLIIERYKSYRWLYHHHRVVVTNRMLEEIVWRLLQAHWDKKAPFASIPLSFPLERSAVASGSGWEYEFSDDADVVNAFRQTGKLLKNPKNTSGASQGVWVEFGEIRALLDEILLRKKRGIPFWKDIGGYRDFNELVSQRIETIFREHQEAKYLRTEARILPQTEVQRTTDDTTFTLNWVVERLLGRSFPKRKQLEMKVNQELRRQKVNGCLLLAVTFFKPWEFRGEREYEVIGRNNYLYHVSDVSPLVKQLREANRSNIRLYAYLILDKELEVLGLTNRKKIVERAQKVLADNLIDWVRHELPKEDKK